MVTSSGDVPSFFPHLPPQKNIHQVSGLLLLLFFFWPVPEDSSYHMILGENVSVEALDMKSLFIKLKISKDRFMDF